MEVISYDADGKGDAASARTRMARRKRATKTCHWDQHRRRCADHSTRYERVPAAVTMHEAQHDDGGLTELDAAIGDTETRIQVHPNTPARRNPEAPEG